MEVSVVEAVTIWLFVQIYLKETENGKYWVHPLLQKRCTNRTFIIFYKDLRNFEVKFFNYTRVCTSSFDELLNKIVRS
nr:unnamed protein product [Callosobruchus analis]